MQELFFLCYYAVVWKMKKKGVLAITLEWIGTFGGNGRRRHLTLIAFAASLGLLDTLKDFRTVKF